MSAQAAFTLDPRLAADTVAIGQLALSRVLLMNDSRFAWLIMVPERPDLVELIDLTAADYSLLMDEIALTSRALKALFMAHKLNVGALGNHVRQLHVHVIVRQIGDAAWPDPVWGRGPAIAYEDAHKLRLTRMLSEKLGCRH